MIKASQRATWKDYGGALLWIALYLTVAGLIGNMTRSEIPGWYQFLQKPPLNPPDFVFGIVWTVLYILMGIAGYRIWIHRNMPNGKIMLGLFLFQTFLNWIWSYLFFYFHMLGFSFFWLSILVLSVMTLLISLKRSDSRTFAILLPYMVWILFAAYLNFMIWKLN